MDFLGAFILSRRAVIEANPLEFAVWAGLCLALGFILGKIWNKRIADKATDKLEDFQRRLGDQEPEDVLRRLLALEARAAANDPLFISPADKRRLVQALRKSPGRVRLASDATKAYRLQQLHADLAAAFEEANWILVANEQKLGDLFATGDAHSLVAGGDTPHRLDVVRALEAVGIEFRTVLPVRGEGVEEPTLYLRA